MSLCQPQKKVSCGACCGLFNLKLSKEEYVKVLEERTSEFRNTVDYKINWTMPDFRKKREIKESIYSKKDDTIYNCPFLGFIENDNKRIGCMIHPILTGDPKSQNYSFYGAGICQAYDCKNKENIYSKNWELIFEEISEDSIDFSKLASNHILISRIENFFISKSISIDLIFTEFRIIVKSLLVLEISLGNRNLTSFEIEMENLIGREEDLLLEYLNFYKNEDLLEDIKKIKKVDPRKS